jgi:hypothetical protein
MHSVIVVLVLLQAAAAFVPARPIMQMTRFLSMSTEGASAEGAEGAELEVEEEVKTIPTYLPSAKGIDYVPLATMLATGDFEAADQFTRDNLIKIGSPAGSGRPFVYWTEVKTIPNVDLCTMERLWLMFSDGNFGYSVQKRAWDVEKNDFDRTIARIGWTLDDGETIRKRKWFLKPNEFIYDVAKAPKGHLPLTSALRGTQLMKALMTHPVWEAYDWKNYQDLKWEP